MSGEVVAIVMVFGSFSLVAVTITRSLLDHLRRSRAEKIQSEIYNKMLDKLGTSQDVLAWMQTDTGRDLFKMAPPERPAPFSRILNSVQYGVVATVLGLALLFIKTQLNHSSGDQEGAMVVGTIVTAIGVGMLLAGGASWALSRKLGLMNGKSAAEN